MNTVQITHCTQCEHHDVEPVYYPGDDTFSHPEGKVICRLAKKDVTFGERLCDLKGIARIPSWCPLIQKSR
jgi:hypothetical protein